MKLSTPFNMIKNALSDIRTMHDFSYTIPNETREEYWDKETINGVAYDLPYNDSVVYHIMGDESARIAAIRTCKVDILEAFRWQFAEQLKRSAPELIVQSYLETDSLCHSVQ